ncbi:Meprin A subunit beta [Liparis tanakae]|uniref:Metalloendopeptidase n=1 Tax=Liparis tanakae TaxID=230148 RepID=A0A4Z2H9V4_9TELE|nr:Meprin A subunit beta [Liparis tanakae]
MTSSTRLTLTPSRLELRHRSRLNHYDVDGGRDRDIFDINEEAGLDLVEGDIVLDERQTRNSIIGEEYRWSKTIPYYMEDDLEINAKGVILKAFEQYRLKTCIDFKPWSGEANYISIFKGGGCFSSVGNRRVGKQRLSIGSNCDRIATIEHEFLHALGFWHEQSRADRDDYVTIMWDRISAGKENNFKTYNDTTSSALGVPYDYGSMMHYSKNAFRNGSEPTIVTKIPAFSAVIGQRMEFSDSDLLKLHRLYNCTQGSTFLDSCDFERENICGMIQGPENTADWVRVSTADGGPSTDYSNMGKCTGETPDGWSRSSALEEEVTCEVGDDWWYYGSSCQYRGSTSDSTTLALASSLSVLGAMLLVTGLSVYCLKKKYKKRSHDSSVVMENVSAAKYSDDDKTSQSNNVEQTVATRGR